MDLTIPQKMEELYTLANQEAQPDYSLGTNTSTNEDNTYSLATNTSNTDDNTYSLAT